MNKLRRKELVRISDALEELSADLEACASEEQEYFDNMPESLQYSEKGTAAEESASTLDECNSNLVDLIESIRDISEV